MFKIPWSRLGNSRSCWGDEGEEAAVTDLDFDLSDFDTSASTSLDGSGKYEADSERSLKSPSAATRVDSGAQVIRFGAIGSLKHRVLFTLKGRQVSPWHDLPLHGPDGFFYCVCKTPAGTWVQYEVADNEPYNPLRLFQKEGSTHPSKYFENAPWNVCMLPKTYSDPDVAVGLPRQHGGGLLRQDGCPLEVIEIGGGVSRRTGEVYLMKPLGAFAVVEDGTQLFRWKIIGIAADHRMAAELRAVSDVATKLPGMLEEIQEWLRTSLSTSAGGGQCSFLCRKKVRNLSAAAAAIAEANASWQLYSSELEPLPQLPGVNPQTAENLEKAWLRYTHHLSGTSIPFIGNRTTWSHSLSGREWANVEEESTPVAEPVGGFMRGGGGVGRRNSLESDWDRKTCKEEKSGPGEMNLLQFRSDLSPSGVPGGAYPEVEGIGGVAVETDERGGSGAKAELCMGAEEEVGGEGGSSSEPAWVEEEDSAEVRAGAGDGAGAAGKGGVEVAQEPSLDVAADMACAHVPADVATEVVHADAAKAMLADCDPRGLKDADVADEGGGDATIPAADVTAVPLLTNRRSETDIPIAVHVTSQMLHATNLVLTRGNQFGRGTDAFKMEEACMKQQTRLAMATSDMGGGGEGEQRIFWVRV